MKPDKRMPVLYLTGLIGYTSSALIDATHLSQVRAPRVCLYGIYLRLKLKRAKFSAQST